MLSPNTTLLADVEPSKEWGDSVPFTDLPVVVLKVDVIFVLGCNTLPICNCNTSNCLFCVAVTVEPHTSPVAFAFELKLIS